MAGMKEIKSRIKSVQSTRQITNAMEIVSTTKFKKYSKLVVESRPYEESMRKILGNIASGVKYEKHPLFDGKKEVKNIAVIVITSDRGLCGSFNSSTLKALERLVSENKDKTITIIPIGKKAIDHASKKKYDFSESFSKIAPEEMNRIAKNISEEVVDVRRFEKELLEYLKSNTNILTEIAEKKALDKDLEEKVKSEIATFKKSFN